jgi:hypothetical protein
MGGFFVEQQLAWTSTILAPLEYSPNAGFVQGLFLEDLRRDVTQKKG